MRNMKPLLNRRELGLEKLRVDLITEKKMSRFTLRYFIENRINVYADDVKEVFKKYS